MSFQILDIHPKLTHPIDLEYCLTSKSGCPKLLAAETKLGYRKISFAITWVYQNLSEELGIYYFICPNKL
jgi:hypothetical protein